MNDIKVIIAKNIRTFRESRNILQKELADKLGVVPSTISNWENGINSPDIVDLFMMCVIFEVSPSAMFGMTEDKLQVAYHKANTKTRQAIDILLGEKDR